MSCQENITLEEKLIEAFDEAIGSDYEFQGAIAYDFLEGMDYYLFCKEDAWDLVPWDEIYEKIKEAFDDTEGTCFDIRALAEKAYGIEI